MGKEELEMLVIRVADVIKHSVQIVLDKPLYTTNEAALFLGVKRSYLYELIRKGKIPYYRSKGGKMIYIRKKDLIKWAEATFVPSRSRFVSQP